MEIATIKRALRNDEHCGDHYGYWNHNGTSLLCMVDGLGHGKHAEVASHAAVEYVAQHREEPLKDILLGCDRAIRDTRGVAMGLALIDRANGSLRYSGVGNTRARILTDRYRKSYHLPSAYGIVGGGIRSVSLETYHFEGDGLVIMYTDGLREVFDMSSYPNEILDDVGALAKRLLDDWSRANDDAAVLVFKNSRA